MPTDQADAYSYASSGDKRMPVLFVAQHSGGLASMAEAWYFAPHTYLPLLVSSLSSSFAWCVVGLAIHMQPFCYHSVLRSLPLPPPPQQPLQPPQLPAQQPHLQLLPLLLMLLLLLWLPLRQQTPKPHWSLLLLLLLLLALKPPAHRLLFLMQRLPKYWQRVVCRCVRCNHAL